MKIGIVGGSIAGCSAAILLSREGHEITVFERSSRALEGRGGGIGTISSLMEEIREMDLIDRDFPCIRINEMNFIGKKETEEPHGRKAWSLPISFYVFRWNELWQNLRSRVPDLVYRPGMKIVGARQEDDGRVSLITSREGTQTFDLVLFADGYNSFGRSILFPEKKLRYRGYILWRGLLPEKAMKEPGPVGEEILRLSYKGIAGHNVLYFIPNKDGSPEKRKRDINWAAYIPISASDLENIMTDKGGSIRKGTLPPGQMRPAVQSRLTSFLTAHMPAYFAKVVENTSNSYIQVIYTLDLDHYAKDRMCLIGDAGIVAQPFTGSGVFKGYNNVKDLIKYLKESDSIDSALDAWSTKQTQTGKRILALGEQMEKAFIWEQPDFAKISPEEAEKWWEASVTFPDGFNYETG